MAQIFRVERTKNFTVMSNHHFKNKNLTLKAKGLLSLMLSLPDKEFCAEKTQDEDYYVLTLAAIARELDGKGMNRATVHIAAGLPLTWVATQKEDFQNEAYRKQKEAEKQLQSLKYQAEQNRKKAEQKVQKLKKRIKWQSEKINEIKFYCGIGYIAALVLSACLIKICFL